MAVALDVMRARAHQKPMRRVSIPQLRQAACDMARNNQMDGSIVFHYAPQMWAGIAFTESDPSRFPRISKQPFPSVLGKAGADSVPDEWSGAVLLVERSHCSVTESSRRSVPGVWTCWQ